MKFCSFSYHDRSLSIVSFLSLVMCSFDRRCFDRCCLGFGLLIC